MKSKSKSRIVMMMMVEEVMKVKQVKISIML